MGTNNFVRHESCPECGSKDNVAVYDDGSKTCFGCGWTYSSFQASVDRGETPGMNKTQTNTKVKAIQIPEAYERLLPTHLMNERKLSEDVIRKYNVELLKKPDGSSAVVFPYYVDGIRVSLKTRQYYDAHGKCEWKNKRYRSSGNAEVAQLFGMQTCKDSIKKILIVEGEIDALAASYMYSGVCNVVSIRSGANGARNNLMKHHAFIDKHDEIFICFDSDVPGTQAADEAMSLFSPGKVKRTVLPTGYKDASEMLMAGKDMEFRAAINASQAQTPMGVLTREEIVENVLEFLYDPKTHQGVPSGFKQLDELMGGFRTGELITLTAGTGVGKTTFSLNLIYNAIKSQTNTLVVPLEMCYRTVLSRLIEMDIETPLMAQGDVTTLPSKQIVINSATKLTEHCHIFNHVGGVKTEDLIKAIEFYCRCHKTRVVLIDHLHAAVNLSENSGNQIHAIDHFVAELKRVALEFGITILLVAHVSRDAQDKTDTKPTLNRIRGSAGIAQNSDMVISLERDRDSNVFSASTLKAHRIIGKFGSVLFQYNSQTMRVEEYETPEFNTEGTEMQEWTGTEDTSKQPRPTLRTNTPDVHEAVHTRLPVDNKDGETDTSGSERVLPTGGQDEASFSKAQPPRQRYKNLVRARQPFYKSIREKSQQTGNLPSVGKTPRVRKY